MKLLIVDDMKSFLDLEKTYLRRAECKIHTASTGLEAIKVAQTVHPDLIVLDVEMPEMNGIEAARILAVTPGLRDIPVVVLSSTHREKEALAAGAKEFVRKPLDDAAFLNLVTKYVPLKVRKDPRKELNRPITFLCNGVIEGSGLVVDLSTSGAFITTGHQLAVGDSLSLRFGIPFPGGLKEIQAEAHVVRDVPPGGYGLGFSDLTEGAKLYIQEFVEDVSR
jgi:CheY-like chemotaxis protein